MLGTPTPHEGVHTGGQVIASHGSFGMQLEGFVGAALIDLDAAPRVAGDWCPVWDHLRPPCFYSLKRRTAEVSLMCGLHLPKANSLGA